MYLVRFNNNTVVRGKAHYHLGNYLPFRLCVYFSLAEQVLKMFRLLLCQLMMSLVETASSPETGFFNTICTHRQKRWHEPGKQWGGGEFNKHMAYSCDVGAKSAALWQEEMSSFSLHCEKLLQVNEVKKKALLSYWFHKAVYYVGSINSSLDTIPHLVDRKKYSCVMHSHKSKALALIENIHITWTGV